MNDNSIDKKKTYTFVFSSIAGTTVGGNHNAFFTVDWSIMPNQPYKITFSYSGEVNNVDGTQIPMVYADFLAATNVYNAGSSTGRSQAITSNFLGALKYQAISATSFLYADNNTNPPIYIASRPMNNGINIQILTNDGSIFPSLAQWVITMHFTPADQPLRI